MKPIKLTLNNFGPFLHEVIDFEQVKDNQLFLISGKTGSGKTMIFDGIVYALFGEASTNERNETDLRSHFADAKQAMSVVFEFELNNSKYKVERLASFIKEGNKTKSPGKLDVYELEDGNYHLRESKISEGNQFIRQLLGVNSEQFRQLFILPQGEFKRFLISSSSSKQTILRTLFNSKRFESIQEQLNNQVKNEKEAIDQRYYKMDIIWKDVEDFNNPNLSQFKEIESIQTEKITIAIPKFREYSKQLFDNAKNEKLKLKEKLEIKQEKLNKNIELEKQLDQLESYKNKLNELNEEQDQINGLKTIISRLNEVRTLSNLQQQLTQKQSKIEATQSQIKTQNNKIAELSKEEKKLNDLVQKLNDKELQLEEKHQYLDKTQSIFSKIEYYKNAFDNVEKDENELQKQLNLQKEIENKIKQFQKEKGEQKVDYTKLQVISDDLIKLNLKIEEAKVNQNNQTKLKEYAEKLKDKNNELITIKDNIQTNEKLLNEVDTSNIDLNDKETFVREIQSALDIGDHCPICGNIVHSLDEHIDFDFIKKQKNLIKTYEKTLNDLKGKKIKIETEIDNLEKQKTEIEKQIIPDLDLNNLQQKQQDKLNEKESVKKENNRIESLEQKLQELKNDSHKNELKIKEYQYINEQNQTKINELKKETEFNDIESFKKNFTEIETEISKFKQDKEKTAQQKNEVDRKSSIEKNNLEHLNNTCSDLNNEIESIQTEFNNEMNRVGLKDKDELDRLLSEFQYKDEYESKVEKFNQSLVETQHEIKRLTESTQGIQLVDSKQLEEQLNQSQDLFDQALNKETSIKYQIDSNEEKFEKLEEHIHYLNNELKTQKEIFNLAEVISGKNEKKLTLETFVLIHYLERIIQQANLRLSIMSGQRYHLKRRESISQGYSGLEIDVFDFHSNKSRHISSLSGGETFQASLALALGLSEVVQQESGGISLDSMFIDEGFGTLDQETLDTALDTLLNLKASGRMVGIISHVSELKQRIPLILEVKSQQYQSVTQFKWN